MKKFLSVTAAVLALSTSSVFAAGIGGGVISGFSQASGGTVNGSGVASIGNGLAISRSTNSGLIGSQQTTSLGAGPDGVLGSSTSIIESTNSSTSGTFSAGGALGLAGGGFAGNGSANGGFLGLGGGIVFP